MKMSNKRPSEWTVSTLNAVFYERRAKVNRIVNFFKKEKKKNCRELLLTFIGKESNGTESQREREKKTVNEV